MVIPHAKLGGCDDYELRGTVVGENDLSEIFAQRPRLNARITELIDAATGPWGIEVSQAPDLVLLVLSFLVFDEFMTFLYDIYDSW